MAGLDKLSNDERIIVVMGPTGAGKTTFVNCIAHRGDHGVGHSIESCTPEVSLVNVKDLIDGRKIVLVDTPGFDDTYTSDIEILTKIASFLVRVYQRKLQLDKILYLHRIMDLRMTGSLMKNLKLFVSLCGIQSMPSVTIVTTMWNRVERKEGEGREQELREKMWFDMIERGCTVKAFDGTYQSAMNIIASPNIDSPNPLVSTEMVDERKELKATAAGNELAKEIKNLLKQRKAANRKLQEISKQSTNEAEKKVLQQEIDETNRRIRTASEQHAALKRSILQRLFGPKPESRLVPQVGPTQVD